MTTVHGQKGVTVRLIDADKLIVQLAHNREKGDEEWELAVNNDIQTVINAPTVESRGTGHWVYDPDGMDWNIPAWRCSECHQRNDMIPTTIRHKGNVVKKVENPYAWAGSKFCANCGAAMERGNTK